MRCRLPAGPQVSLEASAAAAAAAGAGARWIHATVNGMGERGGNADLAEVALTLGALYGYDISLRLERSRAVSSLVREAAGYALAPWKPVVGENLFTRESGAVASQFHDPPAVEPYASSIVGAARRIVLGKKSGLASIRLKLDELGLNVPEQQHAALLAEVKDIATERRGLVADEEVRALARRTHRDGRPDDDRG